MKRSGGRIADLAELAPERLFQPVADAHGLIAAVSGGPDSTALSILLSRWTGRPPTLVVTVDHGLRPEGAAEAALACDNAARLGLGSRVMRARGAPAGNLQAWAREIRYECLYQAAQEFGADALLTAHHQEDQAETFLLRLARGSGVYGLAAMTVESTFRGLRVVRPLLDVPQEQLSSLVRTSGLPVTSDPSNDDRRFDRVRMRAELPGLARVGLNPRRLARTAASLHRAGIALDSYAQALLGENFSVDRFGVARGQTAGLRQAPEEVALRALALILRAVGGTSYTPKLESLEALLGSILRAGEDAPLKRTLNGAVVDSREGRLTFHREWGRKGPITQPVRAGAHALWDGRFVVAAPDVQGNLSIGPLADLARFAAAGKERTAMRTLPALYADGLPTAVPIPLTRAAREALPSTLSVECVVGRRLGLA